MSKLDNLYKPSKLKITNWLVSQKKLKWVEPDTISLQETKKYWMKTETRLGYLNFTPT